MATDSTMDSPDVTVAEATSKYGYTLWIDQFETVPGKFKFLLDCGFDNNGRKAFNELPRVYNTIRGAKLQAAVLTGETIKWSKPCD